MSRVENMFGPRESWGQGDEMAAVRERAVRQEGGQGRDTRPRVSGHRRSGVPTEKAVGEKKTGGDPVKKNAGGDQGRDTRPRVSGHRRSGVPTEKPVGEKKTPSVSEADSSPMLTHRGAKGNGTQAVPYGVNGAKEAKKAGFNRGGGAWGGLAGFVSIRCGGCGKVVNTCLRERTPVFRCKSCGHETSLEKVSNIHMHCTRCGFTGKYRTNRVEKDIQMECLNCSDIVYLTRIRRGNYVPEATE